MGARRYRRMNGKFLFFFCSGLLLLAVVFSYPLILHVDNGIPYSFIPAPGAELARLPHGDHLQLYCRFWLFTRAISGNIPFFSNAYEFATPVTPPAFTAQAFPLSILFSLFAPCGYAFAYNMLVLLSFIAAGLSMALFIHEITGSRAAGCFCGALFAVFPYRLGHLFGGHMTGFAFFLVPLTLYPMIRALRDGPRLKKALLDGAACGLCLFCAAALDVQTTFYLGPLLAAFVLARFIQLILCEGASNALKRILPPLLGALPFILVALAYCLWLKSNFIDVSHLRLGRSIQAVRAHSAGVADLFTISASAEKNVYLGIGPFLLAVWGFIARRREISRGSAARGELFWLYFWGVVFCFCYLMALGAATGRVFPLYEWLRERVPLLAYSRTPNRILPIASLGFFILCGYGVRNLVSSGGAGRILVWALFLLSLAGYHPGRSIGVSILPGINPVYAEVQRAGRGRPLLDLPIFSGDKAWASLYEYYATLSETPIVNGYSPGPKTYYVRNVFLPLRNLNLGEMREKQYRLLRDWDIPFIVLHQEAFPGTVSPYPFRVTLLNLRNSPYLEFVQRDGPHHLFRLRERPNGDAPHFSVKSPIGILYPAARMGRDTGDAIPDGMASLGLAVCAMPPVSQPGWLMHSPPAIYPTGKYSVFFRLKSDRSNLRDPIGRIEAFSPDTERVITSADIGGADFGERSDYRMFGLDFENEAPRKVEFRIYYSGGAPLRADFAYVLCGGETDPGRMYEAEDLFHIGNCVEDKDASGGYAVEVGKDEDLTMPIVSGPTRLYGPGRYLVSFYLKTIQKDKDASMRLEVISSRGDVLAGKEMELQRPGAYKPLAIQIELAKPELISFRPWPSPQARLRLDRIEVVEK
jgi:hypothetical protein